MAAWPRLAWVAASKYLDHLPLYRIEQVAVQQRERLRDAGEATICTDDIVHQPRGSIDTDVCLHAEEPVRAFLPMVHFRIALLVSVLVESSAVIKVASTMVPSRIFKPLLASAH